MIHYHGSPIWPTSAAASFYATRHACVSFAHPEQMALVAETCQSFILDNGAFTAWKSGKDHDFNGYVEFVREWCQHPGFDWCLIPDVIDGTENDNTRLLAAFQKSGLLQVGVPVWHMHESLEHLDYLVRAYPRVALGSSGRWAEVGTDDWWHRMGEAMTVACDSNGRPRTKLHGLRMLSPTVFSHIPLASADSTMVARTTVYDKGWTGSYQPVSDYCRAVVLADRIERHACAHRWRRDAYGTQMNMELIG